MADGAEHGGEHGGEASARERALREVLDVISRSRDDERPVLDVILKNACAFCEAPLALLTMADEARENVRIVAESGARVDFVKVMDEFVEPITRDDLIVVRSVATGEVFRQTDITDDDLYRRRDPRRIQLADVEGVRSVLTVPLLGPHGPIGAIVLYRREVAAFSDDDVALIETFAAQAVIAIENVRQFRELRKRLDQERALKEILGVISQSREAQEPVFDVILSNACAICAGDQATLQLVSEGRSTFRLAAGWGLAETAFPIGHEWPLEGSQPVPSAILTGRCVNVEDFADTEWYRDGDPVVTRIVDEEGVRSRLVVPLLRGGVAEGAISLSRREVRPFSEGDIQIVETFAAQAVIAIENVRQFRELQTRLEREKATREVLSVISRSRDDEAPVFDTIFENAIRLCATPQALLMLVSADGAKLEFIASRGAGREAIDQFRRENPIPVDADDAFATAFRERRPVMIEDLHETATWGPHESHLRAAAEAAGIRSFLITPLVSDGRSMGVLAIYRHEVRPFSADEIALLEGFAAQAVIAIENVRQFRELETLNAELGARVEAQVGELERMGRLKRFLSPQVADAVVTKGEDMLSSHRALIATLFCDIRGFTAFCERAEPEETIEVLQTYHEEMGRLLDEYGAGVDHRSGDGIMAIFNDPLACDDPAGDAIRLALAMRVRMEELCKGWRRLGHRLGFGVGVSLGYATVGMVGSEGRYEYTASGTSVNLAARLCDEAEDGEILISPRAFAAVEDDFEAEPRGEVALKGIQDPVPVYRVLGPRG